MDCYSIASAFTPSEIRARDGSVKLVVGGDAKIYASLLSAADDIIVEAQGMIDVEGKAESYLGNVSIQNGRRNRTIRKESDIIIQKVQLVANGNARFIARKNVNIEGGDIAAGLEVEIVGKNINITPIQLVAENKTKERGSRGFSYYKNNMIYSTSKIATSDIYGQNITLTADNDVNIKASMLMAIEDLAIEAGNDINIVEELVEHYVHSKSFSAHLNFFGRKAMERVLNKDMEGATRAFAQEFGVLNQLNRLIKAKHGPDVAIEGVKSILDLYKEYQAIDKMGFVNYCKKAAVEKLLSSSASLEFSQEKQQWFEAILPVMRAKNILMKAGNNINLRGLQAKAETMSLEAKGNIDIRAAQEHYNYHKKIRTLEVHTSANFDPVNNEFLLPNVGFSAGYQSCSNHGVKHKNANIIVDRFEARTPNALILEGATIKATDVKIIANALLMKSLVDTESGRNKAISGGLDLNLSTKALSGHIEGGKGSYSRGNVVEQTGITAIGEFIAEIGDLTHLQGAYIDAVNATLKTNRLIYGDVAEHDQFKQMDFGIGNIDFSRNSLFSMVDISRQTKNQKDRVKATVSSGVQIVTQSDISNLNRDLSKARELVKNHKHYVRVVVPVGDPTEELKVFESMWHDLKNLVTPRQNNPENAVQDCDWNNPDNVWQNPDYEAICEQLDQNDDLTAKDKVEALKDYTDLERQKVQLDAELKNFALKQDLEAVDSIVEEANNQLAPYDIDPIEKPEVPGQIQETDGKFTRKDLLDGFVKVHDAKENTDKPLFFFSKNEFDVCVEFLSKNMAREDAERQVQMIEKIEAADAESACEAERIRESKFTRGQRLAKKVRDYQESYAQFNEKHPYLGVGLKTGVLAASVAKSVTQTLIMMGTSYAYGMGEREILAQIESSTSPKLKAVEDILGFDREATLTFVGLGLGLGSLKDWNKNHHDPLKVTERRKGVDKGVYNKGNKAYKKKVFGRGQETGTPGHRSTSLKHSIKFAKQDKVAEVYLNRSVDKVTGLRTEHGKNRPDIVVKNKDGTYDFYEVRSKTDDKNMLLDRMAKTMKKLPENKRGNYEVIHIKGFNYGD
jgi:hypothetical protein